MADEQTPPPPPPAPEPEPAAQPEQEPAPAASEPPPVGDVSKDARTMGMLCHLLGIFTCFIGPLVIWLIKKDEMPFVDDQGKEALNFQITLTIAYVVATVLAAITCGIGAVLYPVLWVVALIFGIMGTMKANEGVAYRYPVTIRFIK